MIVQKVVNYQITGAILCIIISKLINKKKNRKPKRFWSKKWFIRRDEGRGAASLLFSELQLEDRPGFRDYARMSVETFKLLLFKVEPKIKRENTVMRECISASSRLLVTLRFLATGETFKSLSFAFRMSPQTISGIVTETIRVIYDVLVDEYLKTPNKAEDWEKVAEQFNTKWNFPFCLGALDGKHIMFRAKKKDGSFYFNYKGFNSIILMALVDANYSFLYVDVGCNGRVNDAGVYRDSTLCEAIEKNLLNFPEDKILPKTQSKVPYIILVDDAFKNTNRIIKPYSDRSSQENKIFNYRFSRGRRVVENAFGMLATRFQVLQKEINLDVSIVQDIVLATCVLHNFIKANEPKTFYTSIDDENISINTTSESWRKNTYITGLESVVGIRSAISPLEIRNKYREFFNTVGMVKWQWDAIKKFNF